MCSEVHEARKYQTRMNVSISLFSKKSPCLLTNLHRPLYKRIPSSCIEAANNFDNKQVTASADENGRKRTVKRIRLKKRQQLPGLINTKFFNKRLYFHTRHFSFLTLFDRDRDE